MLKISKKTIAPFLSYSIFLRGLFFYAAPCIRVFATAGRQQITVFRTYYAHRFVLFSYHYFFLVSDPVWNQTKLAIRQFFDCTLKTLLSYRTRNDKTQNNRCLIPFIALHLFRVENR